MKTLSAFVVAFIVISFVLLALPEKGHSGIGPVDIKCCQYQFIESENFTCTEVPLVAGCPLEPEMELLEVFEFSVCDQELGICSGFNPIQRAVPTLSEWGLIATAVVLGFIGFIMIRRRKAAA